MKKISGSDNILNPIKMFNMKEILQNSKNTMKIFINENN